METIANYIINKPKKMNHWAALLEEWILSIERYCRITDGDAPYWYNERANIGMLAGAAWRCGRIALEEFQHDKVDVSSCVAADETDKKTWRGRCDLWMSDEHCQEVVEAKFCWLDMRSDKRIATAQTCLHAALIDATNTKGEGDMKAIGVAFLPVYAKAGKVGDVNALGEVILSTIKEACKTNADLVAWSFPKRVRKYVSENSDYFPGIILLAKVV